MLATTILLSWALAPRASSLLTPRQTITESLDLNRTRVDAQWDGRCFYPVADNSFDLQSYLGRWYQVAGTLVPFTAGCSCIYAQYSLNDNGTVNVFNACQLGNRRIDIEGTATPADQIYGNEGVFRVQFPFTPPPDCPGPNYIVQYYTDNWAIVQSNNFSTLFVLSRQQNPPAADIDAWIQIAGRIGSNLASVARVNQTGCLFTSNSTSAGTSQSATVGTTGPSQSGPSGYPSRAGQPSQTAPVGTTSQTVGPSQMYQTTRASACSRRA